MNLHSGIFGETIFQNNFYKKIMDLTGVLTVSGLIIYSYNYLVWWLLYFKVVKISKVHHQVIYILLIFNIAILLFLLNFFSNKFLLYSLSLLLLLLIPAGIKGGVFHRISSSAAFLIFLFTMLNYQFFRLIP